jgi:hypothetical protein
MPLSTSSARPALVGQVERHGEEVLADVELVVGDGDQTGAPCAGANTTG